MCGQVKEASRHVEAVTKALAILECFDAEPVRTLKTIREITGLNKSRVIRLCGTLVANGYLDYEPGPHQYKLGSRILRLGKAYERSNSLISVARPVLRDLADQTGESATLYVVDGLKRLCLATEEGTYGIRYTILEGQQLELYAGSGGKVLLAFGPEEIRRKILTKDCLKRLTAKTFTDVKRLEREFDVIRRRGYATSFGERDADAASLAAPIYNHDATVCAAVAIGGPINRFTPRHNARHLKILLAFARRISQKLGYEGQEL